ncbi:mitochondrial coenzyme A diphosphatase NUDT8 [Arctopsyche grandis]|uniref:mitochondrial coenzyme A diphosphatase NUDT8 n=1 Tax=Arctopsyche grandis TaxID=121162 RepID=UPI00406D828F
MNYLGAESLTSTATRDRLMKKLQELPSFNFHKNLSDRKAAVLLPFCIHGDGKVSILYTLRSSTLSSHAGHVAFPGGKADPTDLSLTDTALRETEEELGIPRESIEVWGEPSLVIPSKDFELSVTPVIGVIRDYDNLVLKPSDSEVEDVFTVSMENLCDRQYFGFNSFKSGYTIPVFMGGKHKIWGLTAMITHVVLSCMLPQHVYPMQFQYIAFPTKSKI